MKAKIFRNPEFNSQQNEDIQGWTVPVADSGPDWAWEYCCIH